MTENNLMKSLIDAMSKWDNPPIYPSVDSPSDEPISYEPLINDMGELIVTKIKAPKLDHCAGSIEVVIVEDITDEQT